VHQTFILQQKQVWVRAVELWVWIHLQNIAICKARTWRLENLYSFQTFYSQPPSTSRPPVTDDRSASGNSGMSVKLRSYQTTNDQLDVSGSDAPRMLSSNNKRFAWRYSYVSKCRDQVFSVYVRVMSNLKIRIQQPVHVGLYFLLLKLCGKRNYALRQNLNVQYKDDVLQMAWKRNAQTRVLIWWRQLECLFPQLFPD